MEAPRTIRVHASAALVAASLAAFAPGALAQVRTRQVLAPYYRVAPGPPAAYEAPGASTMLSLACTRRVSPPFAPTRCREVAPRSAEPSGQILAPIDRCYGAPPAPPPPTPAGLRALLTRVIEGAPPGTNSELTVPTTTPLPPTLVLVRYTDVGLGARCVRWTRHCTGLDCGMQPGPHCAASTWVTSRDVHAQWGWVEGNRIVLTERPRMQTSVLGLTRFESATTDAADTTAERATIGAVDARALRTVATTSADPIARHAAWVNLAVDAWSAGDDDALREASAQAARTLADARAAAPPASRAALAAPAEALAARLQWRGDNPIRPPCGPRSLDVP